MKDINNTATNKTYLKVKVALLVQVPFFASLLLDMMEVKVGKFPSVMGGMEPPTAATDGKTMWLDEDFLDSLSLEQACFLVCHETGHAMWQHLSRARGYQDLGFDGKPFIPELWNVAGDYVINAMLVESKTGVMPSKGLLDLAKFPGTMGVDEAYRKLYEEMPKCGGGGDSSEEGSGDGSGDGSGAGKSDAENSQKTLDLHVMSKADVNHDSHEWRRAIESASSSAKAAGKMPASLERLVDQLLNPQVPWQSLLKLEVSRSVGRSSTTWTRPHRRRLVTQGVYLPAYTGHACGEIVVVVDTSGSIGEKELITFLSEVEGILNTCHPKMIYLLGCDAAINSEHALPMGSSLVGNIPKMGGGGGTSFIPPFEWVEENGIKPATLIYLTDMYGPFPDAPKYPVIWCATSDIVGPFGRTVPIDWAAGSN